jgi:hypothetical protein
MMSQSLVTTHVDVEHALGVESSVQEKLLHPSETSTSETVQKNRNAIHTDLVQAEMSTSEIQYAYDSIDESQMRILTVNPGSKEAQLTCSLDVCVRGDPEEYDALSYVWGDEDASKKLYIRHEGTLNRYVMVTPNLLTIIKTMRSDSSPRRIWIDALCINQEDLEEKNTQVPMMSRTYGDAACVRVWLGKEQDDSSVAMELVRRIPLSIGRFERFIADETTLQDWYIL